MVIRTNATPTSEKSVFDQYGCVVKILGILSMGDLKWPSMIYPITARTSIRCALFAWTDIVKDTKIIDYAAAHILDKEYEVR